MMRLQYSAVRLAQSDKNGESSLHLSYAAEQIRAFLRGKGRHVPIIVAG